MAKLNEETKVFLLGSTALLLGILFVWLFYKESLGLNFPLFLFIVSLSALLLARVFSKDILREQYALIGAGLFFSCMVFVRSSALLTFFNVLGSLLLLLLAIRTLSGKHIRSLQTRDYLAVVLIPFQFIGPSFETFPQIYSLANRKYDKSRTREIVRGSIMAGIALFVFGLLLSSADTIFQEFLSHIFSFSIDENIINRTIIGACVTAFFVGAFGFLFQSRHAGTAPSPTPKARALGALEVLIVFSSVNVLFFVFILFQISSLFVGTAHLMIDGLTYADYAREGFFQLVVVAILSIAIISFAEKQVVQGDKGHLSSFMIASGILITQVVAILVSAFYRLSLYENAYGFTTIRLYSHALMFWIGIVLALLARHIWTNGEREHFSFHVFCSIVFLLFSMNILNPDVFIAKENLARYKTTGQLDAKYLGSLSDDAIPYTIHLLDNPKNSVSKSYARELYYRDHDHCGDDACPLETHTHSWQSTRFAHASADNLIFPRQAILEENKNFINTEWGTDD
jgi:hypothetical protein